MPDSSELPALYGGITNRRVRPSDLQRAKDRGERWAMLTSYDMLTAGVFEAAGIPVLLVGDSAGNNVLGHETTIPVTVDELLPMVRAVSRATSRPMVVADLPFGTYQASPEQALATAVRFLQVGGAHAVKLEGGRRVVPAGRAARLGRRAGDGPRRPHPAVRAGHGAARAGPRRGRRRPARRTPSRCRTPAPSPSCSRRSRPTSPSG